RGEQREHRLVAAVDAFEVADRERRVRGEAGMAQAAKDAHGGGLSAAASPRRRAWQTARPLVGRYTPPAQIPLSGGARLPTSWLGNDHVVRDLVLLLGRADGVLHP